ncbi:hypothetical protein [Paenibacillus sp. GYB003]|uniref:hypothetical protein n=1 Tax=Paenibacillus sp. GYB003 TaxID=2994392 RepID=UPI002F962728
MSENRFDEYEKEGFGADIGNGFGAKAGEAAPNEGAKGLNEEFGGEVAPAAPLATEQTSRPTEPAKEPNEEFGAEVAPADLPAPAATDRTPNRSTEPAKGWNEEFGADAAPAAPLVTDRTPNRPSAEAEPEKTEGLNGEGGDTRTGGQTMGWIGLVLAIASMFIYPALLGTAAVVLGIIAYMQGSRALGTWSAVIGGIALIAYFVLVPYYT